MIADQEALRITDAIIDQLPDEMDASDLLIVVSAFAIGAISQIKGEAAQRCAADYLTTALHEAFPASQLRQ